MMKWLLSIVISITVSFSLNAQNYPLQVVSTERQLLQYQENGQLKGPSAEIFQMLLAESGLRMSVDFMPWARAFQIAESTPNTLIFSLIRNEQREDNFHWLLPVSQLIQTFVGKSAKITPKKYNLNDIQTKLTVVVRNTYGHQLLLESGFIENENLYVVSSLEAALNLFFSDKVDFIFTEPNVVRANLAEHKLKATDLIMAPILQKSRRKSYIAINKQSDQAIVELLKAGAAKVVQQPKYEQLFYQIGKN